MGLSFGGSYGSTNSNATSNSTESGIYSAPQTAVRDKTGTVLSNNLDAASKGDLSPGVAAQKTAAADQINTNYGGLQSRIERALASRGFGKSGQHGTATLQTELARQGDLAKSSAAFAGQQDQLNQSSLLAALNYAFTQLGSTAAGQTSGRSSGYSVGGGASL